MRERAEYLTAAGHSVTVVVPPCDGEAKAASELAADVRVIRVAPLLHARSKALDYRFIETWMPKAIRPFFGHVRWIPPVVAALRKQSHDGAILYTMNNPVTMHLIGLSVKEHFAAWVAELRDPIVNNEYADRGVTSVLEGLIERLVVTHADRICLLQGTLGSSAESFRERYAGHGHKVVELPHIGVNLSDYSGYRPYKRVGTGRGELRGIFAGGLYSSPQNLMDAVAQERAGGTEISVHYYTQSVSGYDLQPGNDYCGFLSYWELIDRYEDYDFAIVFDQVRQDERCQFIPSKLYELIAIRRPLLVVGRNDSPTANIVRHQSLGVVAEDNVASIRLGLRTLQEFVQRDTFNNDFFDTARAWITHTTSEARFADVVAELGAAARSWREVCL
jgi:hypothetical protein